MERRWGRGVASLKCRHPVGANRFPPSPCWSKHCGIAARELSAIGSGVDYFTLKILATDGTPASLNANSM